MTRGEDYQDPSSGDMEGILELRGEHTGEEDVMILLDVITDTEESMTQQDVITEGGMIQP